MVFFIKINKLSLKPSFVNNITLLIFLLFIFPLTASLSKLVQNFNVSEGFKYSLQLNFKTIIHLGISLILKGTLINPSLVLLLDFFYNTGFIVLIIGIVPSIMIILFKGKKVQI